MWFIWGWDDGWSRLLETVFSGQIKPWFTYVLSSSRFNLIPGWCFGQELHVNNNYHSASHIFSWDLTLSFLQDETQIQNSIREHIFNHSDQQKHTRSLWDRANDFFQELNDDILTNTSAQWPQASVVVTTLMGPSCSGAFKLHQSHSFCV